MATRVFADEELERLRGPGDQPRRADPVFTLAPADLAVVDPGRVQGPADRSGSAIALCTLPRLGFGPDRVVPAPPVVIARLAEH
ncbi:DUF4158 domain-containing protein [Nocardia sp. CWNU-33]|uniref:DUF4158 domain-containing protein n=1 Tax=Nocardia sp. CWNU-33 TaxID=3392117 RepID=UPI00398EF2EE